MMAKKTKYTISRTDVQFFTISPGRQIQKTTLINNKQEAKIRHIIFDLVDHTAKNESLQNDHSNLTTKIISIYVHTWTWCVRELANRHRNSDWCHGEGTHLLRKSETIVKFTFATPLEKTTSVIIYYEYGNMIRIDKMHTVELASTPWTPINWLTFWFRMRQMRYWIQKSNHLITFIRFQYKNHQWQ